MLKSLTEKPHHIRNVTLLAHVDHGRSTLTDVLIANNLYVEDWAPSNLNQYKNGEYQDPSPYIRNEVSPLLFKLPADSSFPQNADGPDFLINLISSPSHADFTSEFTTNLRACDGMFII